METSKGRLGPSALNTVKHFKEQTFHAAQEFKHKDKPLFSVMDGKEAFIAPL